jgi:hypothetical protein
MGKESKYITRDQANIAVLDDAIIKHLKQVEDQPQKKAVLEAAHDLLKNKITNHQFALCLIENPKFAKGLLNRETEALINQTILTMGYECEKAYLQSRINDYKKTFKEKKKSLINTHKVNALKAAHDYLDDLNLSQFEQVLKENHHYNAGLRSNVEKLVRETKFLGQKVAPEMESSQNTPT